MKKGLLFLLLLLAGAGVYAQNLVVNPSFENTSSNCGNFGGEGFGTDLLNWNNANSNVGGDSCSSPDLFSACNTLPFIGGPSPTNMPNSLLGFQYSRTGTRHAGIITYAPGIATGCTAVGNDNYREYIQGRTSAPLVAGQTYCVAMYVSLGDNVVWGTNNIGVYFGNTEYFRDACANGNNSLINLTPQLNYSCPTAILDTANWVRLQWNYTAVGGERYFIIGNFFNNANTVKTCSNSGASLNPYAYYYIDDVSITPNSCCAATIADVDPVCPTDAPFNLVATPPLGTNCSPTVSGTWSGPGITNASLGTFSPAVAGVGTHTITYTLTCGTVVTSTIVVSNCATLTVCLESNGNLTVTGGTAPYQWQTQANVVDCSGCPFGQCFPPLCNGVNTIAYTTFNTTPTATPPGSFPFRVIDNAGNILTISTLSGIPSCACVLSLTTGSTAATCGNPTGTATVNVSGGTGPFTYAWSNGGSGQTISGLAGGTYTVTVTGGGCSSTATVTVPQTPGIVATTTPVNTTCGNANGGASVNVSSGTGPFSYSWSNGGNTSSISNVAAGTYTVTVTGGGCSNTFSAVVAPSNPVTLSTTSANTSCGNNNGTASVSATTGTGPFTYAWSNGMQTQSVSGLPAGNYTVTVTGAGNCTATASVTINPSTPVTIQSTSSNANCNQADGSASITAGGGTGNYTYLWSNGSITNSISNVPTGIYTVTVTSGTCSATQSVSVGQNTSMASTISGTGTSCTNPNAGSINLEVSGGTPGYTYQWSNSQSTQDISGLSAGTYTVTITDDAGCQIINTFTVEAPESPTAIATVVNESCKELDDGSVNITVSGGTGPYTYLWNNGAITEDIEDLNDGTYTVTITDSEGCTTTQTATVLPGIDFPITVTATDSLLSASTAPNYQWYLDGVQIIGANSQTYIATQSGTYAVTTSVGPCKYGSNAVVVTITAVEEQSVFADIKVYPNPATDDVTVYIELLSPQKVSLNLYDVLGRSLSQMGGTDKAGSFTFIIPVNNLSQGMYFLTIATNTASRSVKLMVK